MRKRRTLRGLFGGLLLVSLPGLASASPITFTYQVTVTSFDGIVGSTLPGLAIGDVLTGQYTFDDATPDTNPGAQFGRFDLIGAGQTVVSSLDLAGRTLRWTGSRIDTFDGGVDFYRFQNLGTFLDEPLIGAATFLGQIVGPPNLINGTGLPSTPPDLALATLNQFMLFIETQQGDGNIFGTISSLYGLQAVIIDETQFSLLIAVVVFSAIIPTVIAQRFFQPSGAEEVQRDGRARIGEPLLQREAS